MLSQEMQTVLNELNAQIDRFTLDELKQFGEYAVSKGIESSGTRMVRPGGAADIMTKGMQTKAKYGAELGYKDIAFKEEKRRFGETMGAQESRFGRELGARESQFGREMGFRRDEMAERKRQYDENKALYEQSLREQEKARKQAASEWWKPFVAPLMQIGASLLFPPAAPALMAANVGSNIYKNLQPQMKPSYSSYGDTFIPKQYDPYANMPSRW